MKSEDRDYSFDEIEVDERFIIAKREMLMTFAVQIAYLILMIFTAYYFSQGDPMEIMMIAGIPGWWVLCLGITLIFIGIIYIMTHKVFIDMDINAYSDDSNKINEKEVN